MVRVVLAGLRVGSRMWPLGERARLGMKRRMDQGSGCVARGELGQSGGFAHLGATWEKESPRQSGKGSGEFMLQRG